MNETTDDGFEIITDDDTIWFVDSDGNIYSYQLTETEMLRDAASNPGFLPDGLPAADIDPDKGGSNGYLADISELSGADETGEPEPDYAGAVLAGDGETQNEILKDDSIIRAMDSDGNIYSYQLTETEMLRDAASNPGFLPDGLPAADIDPDKGGSNGYLADISELSGADETGEPVPDYADAVPAGAPGLDGNADMIMDAIMETYSFDLLL